MNFFFNIIPKVSVLVSNTSRLRMFLTCISLWYFSFTRRFFGWRRLYPVKIRHNSYTITLFIYDVIDIGIIGEIYTELFILKEYEWELPFQVETIIDLGAHFGDTPLYYHKKYPTAKILAIEPIPDNIVRMKRAVTGYPEIEVIESAIGIKDGIVDLYLTPSTFGASLIFREKSVSNVQVKSMSMDTLFKYSQFKQPVDLIKFDIEGGEFSLFKSIEPAYYAKSYIGEVHTDYFKGVSIEDFCSYFKNFEYTLTLQTEKGRYLFRAINQEYI